MLWIPFRTSEMIDYRMNTLACDWKYSQPIRDIYLATAFSGKTTLGWVPIVTRQLRCKQPKRSPTNANPANPK